MGRQLACLSRFRRRGGGRHGGRHRQPEGHRAIVGQREFHGGAKLPRRHRRMRGPRAVPAGQTDTNLNSFSIAHDQDDIIPLVQQALQLNPQLKIMANPWSPPGWMKDSGSMVTGSLLPGMYAPFAKYFVKYLQAYQAAGISVNYISLQNEPLYEPADYPGMPMNAATQTIVLRDFILPALAANNLTNTTVLVYDHNWDRPHYPTTEFSDCQELARSGWRGRNFSLEKSHHSTVIAAVQLIEP